MAAGVESGAALGLGFWAASRRCGSGIVAARRDTAPRATVKSSRRAADAIATRPGGIATNADGCTAGATPVGGGLSEGKTPASNLGEEGRGAMGEGRRATQRAVKEGRTGAERGREKAMWGEGTMSRRMSACLDILGGCRPRERGGIGPAGRPPEQRKGYSQKPRQRPQTYGAFGGPGARSAPTKRTRRVPNGSRGSSMVAS